MQQQPTKPRTIKVVDYSDDYESTEYDEIDDGEESLVALFAVFLLGVPSLAAFFWFLLTVFVPWLKQAFAP